MQGVEVSKSEPCEIIVACLLELCIELEQRSNIFTIFRESYYPCVLILKPGQLLHINKGRLHAFRKMSCSPLDHGDCHYKLRNQVIEKNGITTEQLCTSVAWDWMFLGVSRDGVNGEVMSTLECVQLLHNEGKQSLAIPQLCLIELAKFHLAKHRYNQKQSKFFSSTLRPSSKSLSHYMCT
jgi:hypothetical protein